MAIDDNLTDVLDEGLILPETREGEFVNELCSSKDEHDELLDSMLDDDRLEYMETEQHTLDHDDDILETILSDEGPAIDNEEEYVPHEAIKKLEALLDEGLTSHDMTIATNGVNTIEELQKFEFKCSDSMARELDAILDGDLEEEVNFDVEDVSSKPKKTDL